MSLNKPRTRNEKTDAARRQNGRRSRGAVTEEGRERAAAANLRHGFYSRRQDGVVRALGEDPREYRALMDSVHDALQPKVASQSRKGFMRNIERFFLIWRLYYNSLCLMLSSNLLP